MGIGQSRGGELAVLAEEDGTIAVDVGSRFVGVSDDELERLLDNLAADGGSVRLMGGAARADDGDEPERESDPGVSAAGWVMAMAAQRGISVIRDA